MIELFVSDIDGCLSEPYRPFDGPRLQELAAYVRVAGPVGGEGALPAFSICSGRSLPYVEAMTQVLGLQVPVLFEAGAGRYDPETARVTWHPGFTVEVEAAIAQVRRWMIRECLPGSTLMFDYSKRTQAGLAGAASGEIAACLPRVEAYLTRRFPKLCAFHTAISIDVMAAHITKQEGLHWLGAHLGCRMEHTAYIGDSNGDLGALQAVGYSFAPANATEAVKSSVRIVTDGRGLQGVLEAYRWCCAHNEAFRKKAS